MSSHHPTIRPTQRSLQLCLVAILLVASGVSTTLAAQPSSSATPATDSDTRLYVGHGAQLTAETPSHWKPDMSLTYDYVFRSSFIASTPLPASSSMFDSLASVCDYVVRQEVFQVHGEIERTSWRDMPACIVRATDGQRYSPISLVFAHPNPADDGHNAYVAVTVDAAHFEEITATISFEPARVTPTAYLDSVIDFIQTHSLQRDVIDWPEVREEAHSRLNELVELGTELDTLELWVSYPAIQYVMEQLRTAGADGHNYFVPAADVAGFTTAVLDTDRYTAPTGSPLPNDIGYVSVPGVHTDEAAAARFAQDLDATITNQQRHASCGWIIDLRKNTGGNMYPMLAGLTSLVQPGPLVGFRNANGEGYMMELLPDGSFAYEGGLYDGELVAGFQSLTMFSAPSFRQQPMAILIGPRSGSSGEATAIALTNRDRTRFFGEPTAGLATSPTYLYLFGGSLLSLATHWTTGPQGAIYPDGVHPDVTISPSDAERPLEDDPVVEAASEWLGQQPGCVDAEATPDAST